MLQAVCVARERGQVALVAANDPMACGLEVGHGLRGRATVGLDDEYAHHSASRSGSATAVWRR